MLEQFERALVIGGDLEQARRTLLNEANAERAAKIQQIEHDFRVSVLLREIVTTEPKESAGFKAAKGTLKRLERKYRDPALKKLQRELLKEEQAEAKQEERKD